MEFKSLCPRLWSLVIGHAKTGQLFRNDTLKFFDAPGDLVFDGGL